MSDSFAYFNPDDPTNPLIVKGPGWLDKPINLFGGRRYGEGAGVTCAKSEVYLYAMDKFMRLNHYRFHTTSYTNLIGNRWGTVIKGPHAEAELRDGVPKEFEEEALHQCIVGTARLAYRAVATEWGTISVARNRYEATNMVRFNLTKDLTEAELFEFAVKLTSEGDIHEKR